jgi:hypothetical protein
LAIEDGDVGHAGRAAEGDPVGGEAAGDDDRATVGDEGDAGVGTARAGEGDGERAVRAEVEAAGVGETGGDDGDRGVGRRCGGDGCGGLSVGGERPISAARQTRKRRGAGGDALRITGVSPFLRGGRPRGSCTSDASPRRAGACLRWGLRGVVRSSRCRRR